MPVPDSPVVLVVDDERDLADLFADWLSTAYSVKTAYGGPAALRRLDESVDVVLLDRRMPELSGDEVLGEIRDRGLDCRVAMVTAVDPDVDVVEMGFDDYVTKPVSGEELHEVVDTLLARKRHDETVQEYYRLVSTRAALEAEGGVEVTDDERYESLVAEVEALESELDALTTDFADEDYRAQLHRLDAGATLDPEARDG
jgi:DNA-binding response OmpR family regulator